MSGHFLNLRNAQTLLTRHLLLTRKAVADVIESMAMGAVYGAAGLGKTFAVSDAIARHPLPVLRLTFESRPTMRLVADRLLAGLSGSPGRGTRFALTQKLLTLLAEQPRLIVIGEAQNLNRDCFEYLRHLHDAPETRFGLLFDGGDGCWDVIAREPMLRSRIYRPVAFAPLGLDDVLELIPGYHPIYDGVDPALLELINGRAAHGRLRSWAAFTKTAAEHCNKQRPRISKEIALAAIDQIAGDE